MLRVVLVIDASRARKVEEEQNGPDILVAVEDEIHREIILSFRGQFQSGF